jgi:leucyl aminopeptidase
MTFEANAAMPLWLLHEEDLDAWRAAQGAHVADWLAAHQFKGEKHRVLLVPDKAGAPAFALGGLGRRAGGLTLWHAAGFADRLPPRRYRLAQDFDAAEATQLELGFLYGAYRFDRYRSKAEGARGEGGGANGDDAKGDGKRGDGTKADGAKGDGAPAGPSAKPRVAVLEPPANSDHAFVALAIEALGMARDWINTPAADLGPSALAAAARGMAQRHGARHREWVGDELLTADFPAIHAVGRASADAPRLCEIRWSPRGLRDLPRIALIGKGVCFDTGGLDIKPSSGMALMKKDMGGAAVALALSHMLMSSGIRAELQVLIPAVENSIGGNAYRPGDVLATRKGLTVEVGNTDAEGRLVLCDALALADAERCDLIVDFATLTGAARVALGPELPALFGSDEATVAALARVSARVHDPLWPMPLWMGYDEELGSKIADLNNVASSGLAGAIFGALFLKRFVTNAADWLHVDLYAWNLRDRPGRAAGAEAQAVRGVYAYLIERYGTV